MRTGRNWFNPSSDLLPILNRINCVDQNRVVVRAFQRSLKEESLQRGRKVRRSAADQLRRRLLMRLEYQRFQRFKFPLSFIRWAETQGLSANRAGDAWFMVWALLQSLRSDIPSRIRKCPWCGKLFWSRRNSDRHCSALCSLAAKLLADQKEQTARLLEERVLRSKARDQELRLRFGASHDEFTEHYKRLFKLVHSCVRRPLERLTIDNVDDAQATVAVWRYVFKGVQTASPRLFTCANCGKLVWRRDARMRTCGRACQLQRWRRDKGPPTRLP